MHRTVDDSNKNTFHITPAALGLNLTAEFNRYDLLAASEGHIQGMEALRQLSKAQAETTSLAQMLQVFKMFLWSYERVFN